MKRASFPPHEWWPEATCSGGGDVANGGSFAAANPAVEGTRGVVASTNGKRRKRRSFWLWWWPARWPDGEEPVEERREGVRGSFFIARKEMSLMVFWRFLGLWAPCGPHMNYSSSQFDRVTSRLILFR